MKIVGLLPVRNEEWIIAYTLRALLRWVDEVIVLNHASTDRTGDILLEIAAETCRVLAVLLWPFLPGSAARIYSQLGLRETPDKLQAARWGGLSPSHAIGDVSPLFPRKDLPTK